MGKRTCVKKEPKFEKYVLPFAPELVSQILEKSKWKTYRLGNKYDYLNKGDRVKIQNFATGEIVAEAEITGKEILGFKELPLKIDGHEKYRDKKHQIEIFSNYYAYIGRPIADTENFLILSFEIKEK